MFGFGKKQYIATLDLINAISTNPCYALEAHKEELQKYFDKSPGEGSEKMRAVYFEYLYLNLNLFDRCAFDTLGGDRKTKLLNALGRPIARAAVDKYFEGVYEDNAERAILNFGTALNIASEEYSQCEELIPPSERMFSKKAMATILSRRIDDILNNGELFPLTSIHALAGISFIRQHQRESDLAELITKSAKELGI